MTTVMLYKQKKETRKFLIKQDRIAYIGRLPTTKRQKTVRIAEILLSV